MKKVLFIGALLVAGTFGFKTYAEDLEKVGVAECDDYITKYSACINSKVTDEATKKQFNDSIKQMITTWKQAASTDAGKQALATSCKQALETAKTSMASYGCTW